MKSFNFTERVRKALLTAREEALELGHEYIGTEHVLLGLLAEEKGVAAQVLTHAGLSVQQRVLKFAGSSGLRNNPDRGWQCGKRH